MPLGPISEPPKVKRRSATALAAVSSRGLQLKEATPTERQDALLLFRSELTSEPAVTDPNDTRQVYVLVDGTQVLGALALVVARFPWGVGVVIHSLAVRPDQRNQMLGTALLSFVIQLRSDIVFVWGGCSDESVGFYRRQGFTVGAPGEVLPLP